MLDRAGVFADGVEVGGVGEVGVSDEDAVGWDGEVEDAAAGEAGDDCGR